MSCNTVAALIHRQAECLLAIHAGCPGYALNADLRHNRTFGNGQTADIPCLTGR